MGRAYRHSSAVAPATMAVEPFVDEDNHMPGRAPLDYHEGSIHDAFNRVRSWLVAGEVEPLERNVSVSVVGAGRVEIISGATTHACEAANPLSGTPTECLFQTQAQSFVRYVPSPGAQQQLRLPFCDAPDGCALLVGAYQRVRARFTPSNLAGLSLQVQGLGRVTTNGGESCEGDCTFYFTPNSVLTLSREALPGGVWNQWSGACSGSGEQCQVTLGDAGTLQVVTASFSGTSSPPTVSTLNDTGIDWCANNTTNNLSCPQAAFPDQDGDHGRDALARTGQLVKIGGGEAGFDYTKISNSGNPLPAGAALGTGANDWGCTRDNLSGLIWEVKLNNTSSLRHMDHRYAWYDTNSAINGGNAGSVGTAGTCNGTLTQCNTSAFVAAVNAQGLCGANDWRMPTPEELQGIVHYGRSSISISPAIDPDYFPNTSASGNAKNVVTVRSYAQDAGAAWIISFDRGQIYGYEKSIGYGVRLVRGGE